MKQLYPDLICLHKFTIANSWLKCVDMSCTLFASTIYQMKNSSRFKILFLGNKWQRSYKI